MIDMPRGLLIRCIAMVLGAVPLVILLHVVDPPPNLGGIAILVYAAAMGIGIAEYGVKHPDEIPTRSTRR
jgi:drug/metabolite transporter (DMT)-like permease